MKIGHESIAVGETYHCPDCEFTLTTKNLMHVLICVDHFGAHLTGNAKIMKNTMDAATRLA